MNFSPNKTPIEIIKEGAFGGNCFRDIYSSINEFVRIHLEKICSFKKY